MRFVFAFVICTWSHAALAQSSDVDSGTFFLRVCKGLLDEHPRATFEGGLCAGAAEMLRHVGRYLRPELAWCIPKGVTTREVIQVVVKFLESRPQRLHEMYFLLSADALRSAWPCNKKAETHRGLG